MVLVCTGYSVLVVGFGLVRLVVCAGGLRFGCLGWRFVCFLFNG